MLKLTLKLLVTTVIGIALGGLIRSFVIQESKPTMVAKTDSDTKHKTRTKTESVETNPPTASAEAPSADSVVENERPNAATPLANVESILNYLASVQDEDQPNVDSTYKSREAIRQLVKSNPGLGFDLLEALLNTQDQNIRNQLSLALSSIDSSKDHTLEPWLIERIENGDRPGEWLAILGEWGLKSRSGFDSVLAQLSNNPDPSVVSNSIKALNRTLASYPLAISPNQREDLSSQLKQLLSSSDNEVRSAAVTSLVSFPQEDINQLLLNAFNDSSSKVRHAALMSYMRRPTQSADIQNLILNQLQDPSRSYRERSSLASLALTMNLSEHERTLAANVQQDAEENFMSLTEEQQRALSQNFDDY